jgi:trehalose 6-phosphate synthase
MALSSLRLQLRFLLPLVATLVLAAMLAVPLLDQVTLHWFSRDLNSRGLLVASTLSDSVADALVSRRPARLQLLFERAAQDERLFAIGLCSPAEMAMLLERLRARLDATGGGRIL